jgi:hypothetical protein
VIDETVIRRQTKEAGSAAPLTRLNRHGLSAATLFLYPNRALVATVAGRPRVQKHVFIMSRIRSIKPEFWSSEQVMNCEPITRLFFIGLWNFCDDKGRHPAAERQLKALVFPGDNMTVATIRGMLAELSENGLIELYVVDNKEYIQVTGWKHQKIDKPQLPKFPSPSPTIRRPFADHSPNGIENDPNGIDGREGRGRDSASQGVILSGSDSTTSPRETLAVIKGGRRDGAA